MCCSGAVLEHAEGVVPQLGGDEYTIACWVHWRPARHAADVRTLVCLGLQPLLHRVTVSVTWGYSLCYVRLQACTFVCIGLQPLTTLIP